MHKRLPVFLTSLAKGGENKCMNIFEVLKAVGFGNMRSGCAINLDTLKKCQPMLYKNGIQ